MPVVRIEMWEGRTDEQKEILIRKVTEAFGETGVSAEHVTVVIYDVPKSNWGMRGKQASRVTP